jgi:hypothetical protein
MTLAGLLEWVRDKARFSAVDNYSSFCEEYLSFIYDNPSFITLNIYVIYINI